MNSIAKFQDQEVVPSLARFNDAEGGPDSIEQSLFMSILRQWRIILIIFLVVTIIGMPAVWFTVKPSYQAVAAIRITPVIPSILFGGENAVPMYKNFMYTQADLMTSNNVLQRVADELVDKDPVFFEDKDGVVEKITNGFKKPGTVEPVAALRGLLNSGAIVVAPESNTELIK